ncbi:MAG: NUDIX domain-containing protein [Patescibacteria group bacterium]
MCYHFAMAHIHEKIDFTASVHVVRDGKVLLHKHKKLGIWLPPGGHIELDEDPNTAVVREAKEETGLEIELIGEAKTYSDSAFSARDLVVPRFLNRHFSDASCTHEHVDCVYFGRAKDGEVRPEEEGGEVRWFTKEDIENPKLDILPDIRAHALAALEELAE